MVDDAVATLGWWLIQLRDFQQEHLTVHLPKIQRDYLRPVLDDGDSPALSIDAVNAFEHQDEVVFLSLVLSLARRQMPRRDAEETNNRTTTASPDHPSRISDYRPLSPAVMIHTWARA